MSSEDFITLHFFGGGRIFSVYIISPSICCIVNLENIKKKWEEGFRNITVGFRNITVHRTENEHCEHFDYFLVVFFLCVCVHVCVCVCMKSSTEPCICIKKQH